MSTTTYLSPDDPRVGACASCGARMAADQRYCLSCGARRDHARLPFQDALVPAPPSAASVPPALWYPPQPAGVSLPTMLGALACVLLAFGVGLLVGGVGDDDQQPVVVGGAAQAAPVAAAPTTAAPAADAAAAAADEQAADAAAAADDESSTANSKPTGTEKAEAAEAEKIPTKIKKAVPVDKKVEKDLNSKDPEKAREASQSLPDAVSTGG